MRSIVKTSASIFAVKFILSSRKSKRHHSRNRWKVAIFHHFPICQQCGQILSGKKQYGYYFYWWKRFGSGIGSDRFRRRHPGYRSKAGIRPVFHRRKRTPFQRINRNGSLFGKSGGWPAWTPDRTWLTRRARHDNPADFHGYTKPYIDVMKVKEESIVHQQEI